MSADAVSPISRLTKPPALKPGDKVAAVTLSWGGPGTFPHRYLAGKMQFEKEFGLHVVESEHALRCPKWLAKNPRARAADLMAAFVDPSIKAIISTIGGDDSVRLLPYLDLDVIRRHPKIFMGYSDTTVTHLACFKAGLGSFYGPSFMSGFAENTGIFPYTAQWVRKTLFSTDPIGPIEPNTAGWTVERLEWADPDNQLRKRKCTASTGWKFLQGNGIVTGHLLGGCADVLEDLKGTPFWPSASDWTGAILFLETSELAPPPKLFRSWLRNYAAQGIFNRIAAILFGRPGGHTLTPENFDAYDHSLLQVVRDEEGLSWLPIISRMDFGHTDPMLTLPIGVRATIDCYQKTLTLNESAVS